MSCRRVLNFTFSPLPRCSRGCQFDTLVSTTMVISYTARRHFALEVPNQFYSFANRLISSYFFKRKRCFALIFCNLRSYPQFMTARLPRLAPPAAFLGFFRNFLNLSFDAVSLVQSTICLHPRNRNSTVYRLTNFVIGWAQDFDMKKPDEEGPVDAGKLQNGARRDEFTNATAALF